MKGLPEAIDRLMAIEFRGEGMLDGVTDPLYRAARAAHSGPLAWEAAAKLRDAAKTGQPVYIATGQVHPVALPFGETDGPPGAAALARALVLCTTAPVILLCEPSVCNTLVHTCRGARLTVREDSSQLPLPRSVAVQAFPIDPDEAADRASDLAKDAAAIVTIEKIGRAADGGYYSGPGNDNSPYLCKVDLLVDAIREAGGVTVGIGDLGNEIGMACISESIASILPQGKTIASIVATDVLVLAATSNWGAYAVCAALAGLERNASLVHTAELERDMIFECCRAGGVDGHSTAPTMEIDGAPWTTHAAFVQLLHDMVEISISVRDSERMRFEGS
jgi:hypothetical protein